MAKELNKHTPDSEELFKRLESNDTSGLDDFDREAMEGFDSLDDVVLAKELNADLNRKIDERFFEKKEEKKGNPWKFLSIAAGLVLIVGLSIFFINITSDKKELAVDGAVSSEKVMNDVTKPADMTVMEETTPETETGSKDTKPAEVNEPVNSVDNKTPAMPREESDKKDEGLKARMVLKEPRKDNWQSENTKTADAENDDLKQQTDKNMGPPAQTAPVIAEDQKVLAKKEEKTELYKESDNRYNETPASTVSGNVSTKDAQKKSDAPAKGKKRASGEALATEQKAGVALDEVSIAATNTVKTTPGNSRNEHNAEFESVSFSKPQDYIKTEIDKSEMLKENVKSFKAELSIDEKGKVKTVKFLTNFENCKGCETEMRKILLNMPGWKVNQSGKSVKETISFIYN